MRDIARLALTLMIITTLSAFSLAYVHGITSEIIEQRELERSAEIVKQFFPGYKEIRQENIEGDEFNLVYGEESSLMGVIVNTKANGYGGDIPYRLVIGSDGKIMGIIYGSHGETAGIGTQIEDEVFTGQIVGLTADDPIKINQDVDAISGATKSSTGMVRSIRETMDRFAANHLVR